MAITTGIKSTTTGVLLIKADARPTVNNTSNMATQADPPDSLEIVWLITPTMPVRIMARLSRNIAPTVMTAGLANPDTASAGVRMPVTISTTMMPMAVWSMGIFSLINNAKVMISNAVMIQIAIRTVPASYR